MSRFRFIKLFNNRNFAISGTFLIISVVLFFLLGYQDLAYKGPYSAHSYRQSDSYAFTLNYYYENNRFWEPAILFTGESNHGKTVSEFPALYYLTAKIWKLTGVTPLIPRSLNLILLMIGLFYLFKLSFLILQDGFWAAIVSLLLFSSPLLGFYGFNFIPNIPALGIALAGCYYYYKYYLTGSINILLISVLLFSFGALLKVSALFSFIAINAACFIENVRIVRLNPRKLIIQTFAVIFVLATVFSWYLFSKNYNSYNLNGIFNQSILPLWSLDPEHAQHILKTAVTGTFIYFLNPIAFFFIILMYSFTVLYWRKGNRFFLSFTTFLMLGFVLFLILFFGGLDAHEYFLIDFTVIIPVIVINFLITLKNLYPGLLRSVSLKTVTLLLLILTMNYNVVLTRARINPNDRMVTKNFSLPEKVIEYWKWSYWDWENHYKRYEGIVPYLRSLGIRFDDKVISVPDETPNRTLTFLQQKGFTDYHYLTRYRGTEITERKIELGAKYLILQSEEYANREDVVHFTNEQIGEYQGIKIFKLPGR